MRLFRRRHAQVTEGDPADALRAAISSVVYVVDDDMGVPATPASLAKLRRIVAEAVVLQDQAAELVLDIRRREPLHELASRGGPLARRFFELRRQLPAADGDLARQCETASVLLDHHGTMVTFALELAASEWRGSCITDQLERLDGLGEPAERLDELYLELAR
jgi:hypothetical protein